MAIPKKRKRIFVDRPVQGGIVLRLVALWIGSTLLAGMVWFVMQFFANPTEGFAYYLENAWVNVVPLVMAFAVTLPIAVLQLLKFTHRFAGPVVRLRRFLYELAEGNEVPPLKFRDGDYWPELADEFNRIATALTDARRRLAELEGEADPSSEPAASPTNEELTAV